MNYISFECKNSYKVTAWGSLAASIDANFKPDLETPMISVRSIAKVGEFKGTLFLYTFKSSFPTLKILKSMCLLFLSIYGLPVLLIPKHVH